MTIIKPEDYKFFKEAGDPGFNPSRNKAIIDATIRKNDELARQNKAAWRDKLGERIDASASWLKHVDVWGKSTPLDRYFTRSYLAYLRGDDIRQSIVSRVTNQAWRGARKIRRGS